MAVIVAAITVCAATAFAGSQGGQLVAGLPVFALSLALAFIVQWVAFRGGRGRPTEEPLPLRSG